MEGANHNVGVCYPVGNKAVVEVYGKPRKSNGTRPFMFRRWENNYGKARHWLNEYEEKQRNKAAMGS